MTEKDQALTQAALAGGFDERGLERHVDDIGHDRGRRQPLERKLERRLAGHAEAGRVYQEAGSGKEGIRLRTALVSALGRIGKPASSSVAILVDQAFEPEPAGIPPAVHGELRRTAVTSLGLIGNPEALPSLANVPRWAPAS